MIIQYMDYPGIGICIIDYRVGFDVNFFLVLGDFHKFSYQMIHLK